MVVATGFFDGVHLGHRLVLSRLADAARARGTQSVVVTFWPHPRTVLQHDARTLRLLTSLDEKRRLLSAAGVDRVEVVPFTKEFSRLDTETYLREWVIGRFGADAIVLGYDNRIGSQAGTPAEIARVAERLGLTVIRTGQVDSGDGPAISSTRIRGLLEAGDVEGAAGMLGYRYGLHGVVVAGNQLGRKIGFPTANMQLYEPLKLVPAGGVYLVEVETLERRLYGMCNIGYRPTVSPDRRLTIETHIFDFDEDIYGLDIRISFVRKIRDERRFDSLSALARQLESDRNLCFSLI